MAITKVDITKALINRKGEPLKENDKSEELFTVGAALETLLLAPEEKLSRADHKKRYKLFLRVNMAKETVDFTPSEIHEILEIIPKVFQSPMVGGQLIRVLEGPDVEDKAEEEKEK